MNVLFLTLGRFNNINDKGLYTDLLRYFSEKGHNVFVVAPTERRDRQKTHIVESNRVTILKVKTGNITKSNFIEKGLATLLIEKQYNDAIKQYFSDINFDLILYSTPPITLDNVVRKLKKTTGATTYLMLKDIFPQNAVDLKLFPKGGPVYKYFRMREKNLYEVSDVIGTMSEANSEYIMDNNIIDQNKIEICPNTITPEILEFDLENRSELLKRHGIPLDKRIFIYGGNLGKPQGIDFLISCIEANESNKNSHILIIGSGTEFPKLEQVFNEKNYQNATLINHLPKDEYENLVKASDVGLIFLDYQFTIPNFPSRLLSYMQASKPVIAATDPVSDVGDVIEKGNFGAKVYSNDVLSFNKKINEFSLRNDLDSLGKNARDYLEENYRTEVAYNTIMKHFK